MRERGAPARPRLGYANVVSTLALALALGGGIAWAVERNSVRSIHIANGQVRAPDVGRAQVRARHIGQGHVRPAAIRDDSLGVRDLADPAWRRVGSPGGPAFAKGGENDCVWSAQTYDEAPQQFFQAPSFSRDATGAVRLGGTVVSDSGPGGTCDEDGPNDALDNIIFTLPSGYRPEYAQVFPVSGSFSDGQPGHVPVAVLVTPDSAWDLGDNLIVPPGSVYAFAFPPVNAEISLDGIEFLAGGPE